MRDTMAAGPDGNPQASPAPDAPPPLYWWLLRALGFLFFAVSAVYGWWSPDTGWFRPASSTAAAVFLAAHMLRHRPGAGRGR
ncbi:MAG TPA: hypothetical protein VIS29_13595 [Streptomyces sp.]